MREFERHEETVTPLRRKGKGLERVFIAIRVGSDTGIQLNRLNPKEFGVLSFVSGTTWPKTAFQYDETANSQLYQVNAPFSIPDGDPLIAGDLDGEERRIISTSIAISIHFSRRAVAVSLPTAKPPILSWCKGARVRAP